MEEFGPERIIDSPISEAGITGLGVGAAMTGMRPVVDIMFGDFLTLVMDQLANQAAKMHYMSGGKLSVPLVLRTTLGATRRSAAQHSQSLHAWVAPHPGLKVVLPSTPYDAKGLLKAAIRDDNPVVFFEDKMDWRSYGPVPEEEYVLPLGVADVKREGEDVTIVGTSSMVRVCSRRPSCSPPTASRPRWSTRARSSPLDEERSCARRRRPAARSSSTRGTAATASRPSSRP